MIYKTINLTKIKTVYATCSKFTERQVRLEKQLNELNLKFEKFEGRIITDQMIGKCENHQWIGSCENHKNILKNNINDDPLFVLEDDVIFTNNFNVNLQYPGNADAIYIGKSLVCLREQNFDYNFTKLNFSFGLHGILYLNKVFKIKMLECFEKSLSTCMVCDKLTGDLLKTVNVYAPKKCWMYQDNISNVHNKLATEY